MVLFYERLKTWSRGLRINNTSSRFPATSRGILSDIQAAANLQCGIKSPSMKPMISANGIQSALDAVGPFWNAKMHIVARLPDINGPLENLIQWLPRNSEGALQSSESLISAYTPPLQP